MLTKLWTGHMRDADAQIMVVVYQEMANWDVGLPFRAMHYPDILVRPDCGKRLRHIAQHQCSVNDRKQMACPDAVWCNCQVGPVTP